MSINIMAEHNKAVESIPDTHFRAQLLSTEDNDIVSTVADYFTTRLNQAGNALTNSMRRVTDNAVSSMSGSEINKFNITINDIKAKIKYNDVSAIKVPVTLGMKVDLHTAVSNLYHVMGVMRKEVPDVIGKLDVTASKMLSNSDFRTSSRPFKDNSVIETKDKLNDALSSVLDASGTNDRMPVKDLLPNLSSLIEINSMLGELTELTDKKLIKGFMKQTKGVSENIDFLYEEYKKNQTVVKKERLIELGYYLENGAGVITTYVSLVHLIGQLKETFKHTVELLKKNI